MRKTFKLRQARNRSANQCKSVTLLLKEKINRNVAKNCMKIM